MNYSENSFDFIRRKSAKISLDGNWEEILKSISDNLNIPIEMLDKEDIIKKVNQNKQNYEQTFKIIEKYYKYLEINNAPKDKFDELNDIGKFLRTTSNDYNLVLPDTIDQIPDFIVNKNQRKIGIEHTRMITQQSEKIIGDIKKILYNVQAYFLERSEFENKLISIELDYSYPITNNICLLDKMKQKDKSLIAIAIANDIINYNNNSSVNSLTLYIKNITFKQTLYPTEISLIESYFANLDFKEQLLKTVEKKEKKFNNYKTDKQLQEIWLLIINSGIKSSASFDMRVIENFIINKSNFDKIFLMDNFDYKIIRLH